MTKMADSKLQVTIAGMAFCQLPYSGRVAREISKYLKVKGGRRFLHAFGYDNSSSCTVLGELTDGKLAYQPLGNIVATLEEIDREECAIFIQRVIIRHKEHQNYHQELGDGDIKTLLQLDAGNLLRKGVMNGADTSSKVTKYILMMACIPMACILAAFLIGFFVKCP